MCNGKGTLKIWCGATLMEGLCPGLKEPRNHSSSMDSRFDVPSLEKEKGNRIYYVTLYTFDYISGFLSLSHTHTHTHTHANVGAYH